MLWHTALPRCCQQAEHHPLRFKLCSYMVNYQWNIINQVHLGHLFERQLTFMATCSRWYNSSGLNDCTFCICVSCIRVCQQCVVPISSLGGLAEVQELKKACKSSKRFSMSKAVGLFPDTLTTEKNKAGWCVRLAEQVVTANRHFN